MPKQFVPFGMNAFISNLELINQFFINSEAYGWNPNEAEEELWKHFRWQKERERDREKKRKNEQDNGDVSVAKN